MPVGGGLRRPRPKMSCSIIDEKEEEEDEEGTYSRL